MSLVQHACLESFFVDHWLAIVGVLVVTFIVGGWFGALVMALAQIGRDDDRRE